MNSKAVALIAVVICIVMPLPCAAFDVSVLRKIYASRICPRPAKLYQEISLAENCGLIEDQKTFNEQVRWNKCSDGVSADNISIANYNGFILKNCKSGDPSRMYFNVEGRVSYNYNHPIQQRARAIEDQKIKAMEERSRIPVAVVSPGPRMNSPSSLSANAGKTDSGCSIMREVESTVKGYGFYPGTRYTVAYSGGSRFSILVSGDLYWSVPCSGVRLVKSGQVLNIICTSGNDCVGNSNSVLDRSARVILQD